MIVADPEERKAPIRQSAQKTPSHEHGRSAVLQGSEVRLWEICREQFTEIPLERRAIQEIGCGFGIRTDKRRRVYECYWAHFAAEIHLSE